MSGKFSMDDYVDVAERISVFKKQFPDGSIQGTVEAVRQTDLIIGWFARAEAYRTPDDPRPGVGHAFEPVPGKTPYTRDSECMNAETSAWGRAIVALGFPTKKIASRNEVQNRRGDEPSPEPSQYQAPALKKASKAKRDALTVLVDRLIAAGHLTGEQFQQAAKTAAPWPDCAEELTAPVVDDMLKRLTTWEANLARQSEREPGIAEPF